MSASFAAFERSRGGNSNTIFKSGHLLISSKGLGWKFWKKRWFILTRTSLVFFKNDPSAIHQHGGEVNLTLGGIDLNNSGSVVIREDKKLLTVLFPDGRDGRAFTLKVETSEDLHEWKIALENALAQAPNAALVMEQNGIFRSDVNNEGRENHFIKSLVVGRPILLALEDIDGGPSFLEKALQFLETRGIKVEGILRQAADVEEVERRVQEYEQGRVEFEADEDAHVVGDCVKHVLRELPSSPVPASCCTALLEAYKIDPKEARVNAMCSTIQESLPEPNRRLLKRLLKMMHTICSHSSENRMTSSAVAACMAPLLLRPLLSGEYELEDDYEANGDSSAQLLAAANAANLAQAIITTLLEGYNKYFNGDSLHSFSILVSSRNDPFGSEVTSQDENPVIELNGYNDVQNGADLELDLECDRRHSGKFSERSGSSTSDLYDLKSLRNDNSEAHSPVQNHSLRTKSNVNSDSRVPSESSVKVEQVYENGTDLSAEVEACESQRSMGHILLSMNQELHPSATRTELLGEISMPKVSNVNAGSDKRSTFWGRNNSRKAAVEPTDSSGEEELAIQRLEIAKNNLRHRIAEEARGTAILQASLERRKQALHERRLALEQDVARLQEQLQAERDLRATLEVGLSMSSNQISGSRAMDSKTRAELKEIALAEADVARLKQKVADLHQQLNHQRHSSLSDACYQQHIAANPSPHQEHLQQHDFDTTLAFCNHKRKQRTEELSGAYTRSTKVNLLTSIIGRRLQFSESSISLSEAKSAVPSTTSSKDGLRSVNSAPSTSRVAEVMDYPQRPSAASSTLVELTTRLDFFKERRSQLMAQLHNLDLNY